MAKITVGLDFGTHQTKICIEDKTEVNNPIYSFFPFEDLEGNKQIILPSVIQINKDNTLSYGFVDKATAKYGKKFVIGSAPSYPKKRELRNLLEWYKWQNTSQINHRLVYRYFKQSTFSNYNWNCTLSSTLLSVWYLSFVIFHIEERYGKDFAIQMGIPTGSDNFNRKKQKAVSLLLTAFHLVEDVFECDLNKFLATPLQELKALTEFIPYSDEKKFEYSLLVFPEAYASLKSLINQKRIESGMSLMVDIGGGTTDITFFTIENGRAKIYDYSSIPLGLNFIAESAAPDLQDRFDSLPYLNDIPEKKLNPAIEQYYEKVSAACYSLVNNLFRTFEKTGFPSYKLKDALKDRALIYSGGGSTYEQLRMPIGMFTDIICIDKNKWKGMSINRIEEFSTLCPIISTSLGLSISEIDDNIELSTVNDIFKHLEGIYQIEEKPKQKWV